MVRAGGGKVGPAPRRRAWWWAAAPVLLAVAMTASLTATLMGPASAGPSEGNDISWPQCGRAYPAVGAFGIVGVNDGRPDTVNPCLVSEYRWASSSRAVEFYMNTDNPALAAAAAYNYGFAAARFAYTVANSLVAAGPGHVWWLDVETANTWTGDQGANTMDIAGSIAFLRTKGVTVGIYSTRYQWGVITGGASIPSAPNWVPGATSAAAAPSYCAAVRSFSGGPVVLTQYTTQFDYDYVCPAASLSLPPHLAPPTNAIANVLSALLAWLRGK